ncbi:MAG: hypothetical protein AMXMBFR7_34320 [Planctomycetota bacterium]
MGSLAERAVTERVASPPEPAPAAPAHFGLAYYLKRSVLYLLGGYLVLCAALFAMQRKLIYAPTRAEAVDPQRAGLAPDRARNVTVSAADGVTLGGWHVRPEADAQEPDFDASMRGGDMAVLFFHGNGGHRGHRAEMLYHLSRRGLHACCFDYRGYGDSEGAPHEEGLALDARAALAWVRERGIPPERTILWGESLGCAVAVRLAEELCAAGTPPGGLALEMPFTSLTEVAAHLYWFVPVRLILQERYPSIERIPRVTCPLLVIHGTDDRVVPFEHGRRLFEAAPAASAGGIPKRFLELPGVGHQDLGARGEAAYTDAVGEFLAALRAECQEHP